MREERHELVVVGAGPGGIASAATARAAVLQTLLIDEGASAGGQIWRSDGSVTTAAKPWIECLKGVEHWTKTREVAAPGPHQLLVDSPEGPRVVRWRSLILATGARELLLPFPGWTLPGVFGAGGLQALVKQGMEIRGKRVVVAGTGPLLLAVGDYLRSKGGVVPAILEQATAASVRRFGMSLWRFPEKLAAGIALRARLRGTRYVTGAYSASVVRDGSNLRVEYRTAGPARSLSCDFLACGFHLVPNVELAHLLSCSMTERGFVRVDARLRTSAEHVYAVGELTGIGGVEKALVEGEIAAHAVAGEERALRTLEGKHRATLRFMDDLDRAFALRNEVKSLASAETIVCRCEDVPLGALRGFSSARAAKLQTRCGMGACQNRVCGPILRELMGPGLAETPHVRPPVIATRVGVLATIPPGTEP